MPYSTSRLCGARFHGPPPQGAQELDETQVAHQPVLEAPEPLEADDSRGPRPETALALDPADHRIGRQIVEPLELDAPAEPDEGCAPTLVESEPA